MKVGSDFSGVGAFDQALIRLGVNYKTIFACDMDKYARQTFIENYGEPEYYPTNVYDREIPTESLDIYMTSPPCQSFSLAGSRKGKDSKNGILFFNSHEFIQKNKPKYFIFENVKGLLSDDNGKTFSEWLNMLGGKSVNGNPVIFPYDTAVPYHIYYKVLNSKKYGVPQNRERIFIVGIRDNNDNAFTWPKEKHLTKKLKDVLESDVDEKYYLSDKMLNGFISHAERHSEKGNGFKFEPKDINKEAGCITTSEGSRGYNNFISDCGYIKIAAMRGRNPNNTSDRTTGCETKQTLEINKNGTSNCLTSVQKDNLVVSDRIRRLTPRECFRLQDFPDTFKMPCSDSQMYKQAGNSITVGVLYEIIKKLIK